MDLPTSVNTKVEVIDLKYLLKLAHLVHIAAFSVLVKV